MLPFGKMDKADKEIGDILEFIGKSLAQIKHGKGSSLTQFAKEVGLGEKNLSDFLRYTRDSNPQIRTVYRILRGLLKRAPISIKPQAELKSGQAQLFNQFMEIINDSELIDSGSSLETLKGMVGYVYQGFSESKKAAYQKKG